MRPDHLTPGPRGETVYAHRKRLDWIRVHLAAGSHIVELGCGTGYMVTLPLLAEGRDITGVDRDRESIAYGRQLAEQAGLSADRLVAGELDVLSGPFDVVIASEVLEHLDDKQLDEVLMLIHRKLRPGGALLVTVPNGFGWYEFEAWLWNRVGLGRLLAATRLDRSLMRLKVWLSGKPEEQLVEGHPSSLDSSPHVQRFTHGAIRRRLAGAGFKVTQTTGSSLFAGQFSNLLFTGYDRLMRWNAVLGDRVPTLAAGFFVACMKDGPVTRTPGKTDQA